MINLDYKNISILILNIGAKNAALYENMLYLHSIVVEGTLLDASNMSVSQVYQIGRFFDSWPTLSFCLHILQFVLHFSRQHLVTLLSQQINVSTMTFLKVGIA
jgi:hypothetical protein